MKKALVKALLFVPMLGYVIGWYTISSRRRVFRDNIKYISHPAYFSVHVFGTCVFIGILIALLH